MLIILLLNNVLQTDPLCDRDMIPETHTHSCDNTIQVGNYDTHLKIPAPQHINYIIYLHPYILRACSHSQYGGKL